MVIWLNMRMISLPEDRGGRSGFKKQCNLPSSDHKPLFGRDGFSEIGFPLCDGMCYQIKQRVESTWSHSYIRQAVLFIDQNFVYKVVELPVGFSLQVNSMNPISSPPVIAFLFQTIQNCQPLGSTGRIKHFATQHVAVLATVRFCTGKATGQDWTAAGLSTCRRRIHSVCALKETL